MTPNSTLNNQPMFANPVVSDENDQTLPTNVSNYPVLYEGDYGRAVVELQQLLNAKAGAALVVDGYFGFSTKAAVMKFQQQRGLIIDGIVGQKTWAELFKTTEPPISLVNVCQFYNPTAYPHQTNSLGWLQHQIDSNIMYEFIRRWTNQTNQPEPILYQGDRGPLVVELQQRLNARGATLVVDGVFGSSTTAEVMKFQQLWGLVVDGVVGPMTWRILRRPTYTIVLADYFRAYSPTTNPQHTPALEWFQRQLSVALLEEFAKRWRNQVV